MNLKTADEIIREARLFGWYVVIQNARYFDMAPVEMVGFWERNAALTPRRPYPRATDRNQVLSYAMNWPKQRSSEMLRRADR